MRINNVCVNGLGYVGLTLAVTLAEEGFKVFGVDKNKEILKNIRKGIPHFHEKGLKELILKHKNKNLFVSEKIPEKEKIDAFIIAVGTPLNPLTKKPRMEYIANVTKEVSLNLSREQLVVLRSTVPVGTSRNVVLPILKKKSDNFYLSFCPERTIEGKALVELRHLPQIVGALDEESMLRTIELFSRITPTIVKVDSLETAEIIKMVDNSYRDVNFAFTNEVALICKDLGLNAKETIRSANFGYDRNHIPIPGFVGGACLEKDPYILAYSAKKTLKKINPELIKISRRINEDLPEYVFRSIKSYLNKKKKSFQKAKIFISGFAFKGDPETDDLRGSPTLILLNLLKEKGNAKKIYGHDFVVKNDAIRKLGVIPCSINKGLLNADVSIFMNNHKTYQGLDIENLIKKTNKGSFCFDGWQFFYPELKGNNHIIYESLGFKSKN